MVLRVSAATSKEVAALIAAMKRLNRETAKYIRAQVKSNASVIVAESLRGHAVTRLQVRGIVDTTRVTVSDQNVSVQAGAVRGKFENGLDPRKSASSLEFGSNGGKVATYDRRSRNGVQHKVTRHTMRQFGPAQRKGKTFYPAVHDMAPRIIALYVQTLLRTVHEAVEKR